MLSKRQLEIQTQWEEWVKFGEKNFGAKSQAPSQVEETEEGAAVAVAGFDPADEDYAALQEFTFLQSSKNSEVPDEEIDAAIEKVGINCPPERLYYLRNFIRNIHTILNTFGETISVFSIVLTINAMINGFGKNIQTDARLPLWIGSIGWSLVVAFFASLKILKVKNQKLLADIYAAFSGGSGVYLLYVIIGGSILANYKAYIKNGEAYVSDDDALAVFVTAGGLAALNGFSIFAQRHFSHIKNIFLRIAESVSNGFVATAAVHFFSQKIWGEIQPDNGFDVRNNFLKVAISTPTSFTLGTIFSFLFPKTAGVSLDYANLTGILWILIEFLAGDSKEAQELKKRYPALFDTLFSLFITLCFVAPTLFLAKHRGNLLVDDRDPEEIKNDSNSGEKEESEPLLTDYNNLADNDDTDYANLADNNDDDIEANLDVRDPAEIKNDSNWGEKEEPKLLLTDTGNSADDIKADLSKNEKASNSIPSSLADTDIHADEEVLQIENTNGLRP